MDLTKIEIFLLGDFNIDIFEKNNVKNKNFLNTLKQFGLKQLIDEPQDITLRKIVELI